MKAKKHMQEREHIASTDCWCKPHMLSYGDEMKLARGGTIAQVDPVLGASSLNVHIEHGEDDQDLSDG
jgi:hypothetical protein